MTIGQKPPSSLDQVRGNKLFSLNSDCITVLFDLRDKEIEESGIAGLIRERSIASIQQNMVSVQKK